MSVNTLCVGELDCTPSTPLILVILRDAKCVARFREAFGMRLCTLHRTADLEAILARRAVDLIVMEPWDTQGHQVAPVVRRLVSRRQWPPVVIYTDPCARSLRELPSLFRAGATAVVLRDVDDSPTALRQLLNETAISTLIAEAQSAARRHLAHPLLSIVESCLAVLPSNATAAEIAGMIGRDRRTLSKWAMRCSLRGLKEVRSRARLLVALGLITRAKYNAEQAAFVLGFSSGAHLGNTLRRHVGIGIRQIGPDGDLSYWCRRVFASAIVAQLNAADKSAG